MGFAPVKQSVLRTGPGARSLPSASSERQRLIEAEDVPRVIACLGPNQLVQVRPVVGICPAIQIRVSEILEHAAGAPWMHGRPGPRHLPVRRFLVGLGGMGLDDDRMLELEQLLSMDERDGVGTHAVVRTAPRHEVELAGLPRNTLQREGLQQHRNGLAGQGSPEELRLRDEVYQLAALTEIDTPVHTARTAP